MSNNRRKRIWPYLLAAAAAVLLLCGLWMLRRPEPPVETEPAPTTEAPTEPVTEPEPETEPEPVVDPVALREIDWAALKERNEDVVGWIYVPDTPIDYPVMWKQADNTYYNRRDIDRTQGSYRGVYMDGDDVPEMTALHNLLYGHHMKDGSMFTAVCDFKDEEFFRTHQRLYFYTPEHVFILKPIACLYADGIAERRRIFFRDREDFDHYVEWMSCGCDFRDIPEEGINQLFTLVTCSYELGHESRTLLQCCEIEPDGTPAERVKVEETELPDWAEQLRESTEKMLLEAREEEARKAAEKESEDKKETESGKKESGSEKTE